MMTRPFRCMNQIVPPQSPPVPPCFSCSHSLCWHSVDLTSSGASLVAQRVKRLPAVREIWVWSLGGEDPPKKEMATHSSTLTWKTPWTEKPGRLQAMECQRVRQDWATSLSVFTTSSNVPNIFDLEDSCKILCKKTSAAGPTAHSCSKSIKTVLHQLKPRVD